MDAMASLHAQSRAIESALDRLTAHREVVEITSMDLDALPELRRRVNACKRAFLSLPLPQQPDFVREAAALEASIEEASRALERVDLAVPIGMFRRRLHGGALAPRTVALYARALADRPFDGGPRQARFEMAVTHALFEETEARQLVPRPDEVRAALLDVVLEGIARDEPRREEIVRRFEGARVELAGFSDSEQMFAADFDRDLQRFTRELGDALLDREVLEAMVRFDAALRSRAFEIPASSHPMSLPPAPRTPKPVSERPKRAPVLSAHGLARVLARAVEDVAHELGEEPLGARALDLAELAGGETEASADARALAEAEAALSSDEDVVVDPKDRVVAIEDVLAMLEELGVEPKHVALVRDTLAMCRESLVRLGDRDAEGHEARLASFEESLEVGEDTTLEVEALVSMGAFRSWFERGPRSRAALLRYARLLGGSKRLRDVQRDRLEFILSRLFSKKMLDGQLEMASRGDVAKMLEYVLRERPKVPEHERASAVMFFREAALRLASLSSLDEVFSGGFYLDVRGFKVALRGQLLDPDILYAAVALNVAIHNRIEEMRELESRSRHSLHGMLQKQNEVVEAAFTKPTTDERFETTRRYLEKYRENVAKAAPRRRVDRRTVMRALLTIGIGLGALVAFQLIDRDINDLEPLSEQSLARLSPLLESGSISRGESEPAFIGRVASSAWAHLSVAQRRTEAERIRNGLEERHVRAAWVTDQGHPTIQIANAEIVAVQ